MDHHQHHQHHNHHVDHVDQNSKNVQDHEELQSGKTCPMIMFFHGGHCEQILWESWLATTVTEFVLSAFAIFLLAFSHEMLKFLREYIIRNGAKKEAVRLACAVQNSDGGLYCAEIKGKSYLENLCSWQHIIQTLLNLVQITLSYLLMLVFMTFNYWLCLAVVLGLSFGYYLFGWSKYDVDAFERHEMDILTNNK